MKKRFILIIMAFPVFLVTGHLSGQEWEVPADQLGLKNPLVFNNDNVKAGKELYLINCKSCHGDPGKNNGLALVPPPPDVTSELMLANTEGSVFYKITAGRQAMPGFATTLTEEQRWKIVHFMKSYDPANEGLLIKEEPLPARIQASADEAAKLISLSAQVQNKAGDWVPLAGGEVYIKAKRTFGSIEIGKAVTNDQGYAEFRFPPEYRGDEAGVVNLEMSLGDEFKSNALEMKQVKIAAPAEPENLFRDRVLWSTNPRTQIWLILAFPGVVGGVWLTIFYIIFLIFKIYKAGKE